jgi:hypothetical protein
MAVYVDPVTNHVGLDKPVTRRYGTRWTHMIADSRAELDAMAVAIGLQTKYIQDYGKWSEHYDLTPSKRALAVSLGAIEITTARFVNMLAARRGQPPIVPEDSE